MKLYDCHPAPNPRRVRIFIAEKGLTIETQQVDFMGREQLTEAYQAMNPLCDIPVLELDDGSHISQVNGICRYLEAAFPEPNLYGRDAKEQGLIAMWDNWVANNGIASVADGFRNFSKGLADHAVTGVRPYAQIPALAERGRQRTEDFFEDLDKYLGEREFVACDRFSTADISAFIALEFAQRIKLEPKEDQLNIKRWHQAVSARPSTQA
ncbi:glutathione S-transferase [Aurantivibrio plasticivorans]